MNNKGYIIEQSVNQHMRKIFTKYTVTRGLVSRIYKEDIKIKQEENK